MAETLFGPTPEELRAALSQQQADFYQRAAQVSPAYSAGAGLGGLLGGIVGSVFGVENPELKKAKQMEAIQQKIITENPSLSDQGAYYDVAAYELGNAGFGREAIQAKQMADKFRQEQGLYTAKLNTEEAQAAKYTAEAANKQAEFEREQLASQTLQTLYSAKKELGQVPTTEEIISAVAPYVPADKLATMMQTSADKAAYRQTMMDQAKDALEGRIEMAKQRQADAKEIAQMRIDGQRELKQLAAQLNPKNTSTSSVYERGYANNFVTSSAELVPATSNLNILTQGGTSPVTAGVFTNIKGTGILSSTSATLGTAITPAEQGQYESIMLPVIQNIGTMQNAGRRTTIGQLDNLKNALIAKAGQPYIVQVQKMGELRQIAEAASEAAMANPALSDDQKALVQANVQKLQQSIPFTGADVAKYSVYAKKNPNVAFKDWLKVNGTDRGSVTPAPAAGLQEGMTGNSKSGKPMVVRNGKWEYK
jgi:hypothetical protein